MPRNKVNKLNPVEVSPQSPRRSQRLAAKKPNVGQQGKSFLKNKENLKHILKQSQKKSPSIKKNDSGTNILCHIIKNTYNLRNRAEVELRKPTHPVTRTPQILKCDNSLKHIEDLDLVNNISCHSYIKKEYRLRNQVKIECQKTDNGIMSVLPTHKGNKRILKKNNSLSCVTDCDYGNNRKRKLKNNTHSQVFVKSSQNSPRAYMRHPSSKSDSFEEYGILLPSYESILSNINKMNNEAKALDTYEELYEDLDITLPNGLRELINGNLTPQKSELLDCKHLSKEKLTTYFENNLDHLRNIFKGVTYSERHEKYKHYDLQFNFSYCTSTVIYTEEQKDHLLVLLEESFDPEVKHTQYLFKVLLPELCLKIFMDAHNKSNEEAIKYLEWRPVE